MSVFESFSSMFSSESGSIAHSDDTKRSYQEVREESLKRLYKGVEVRDRKYRLKKYRRCFIGSEAVDFMVLSGWAKSRSDAVRIGRRLQEEFNLFEHVVEPDRHKFEDDYLFFKFNEYTESSQQGDVDSTGKNSSTSDEDEVQDSRRYQTSSLHASKQAGLTSLGELLRKGVKRKYNYSLDKEGFHANEAVDYMVSTGLATSRSDAVSIGLALQDPGEIIVNETSHSRFSDTKDFFSFASDPDENWRKNLEDARDFFRNNMKAGDHTYHLKVYRNTFTGKEAVDLLLMAGLTSSRQDAVLLGRSLMIEYNLFGHVTDEHEFLDEDFFYKFAKK